MRTLNDGRRVPKGDENAPYIPSREAIRWRKKSLRRRFMRENGLLDLSEEQEKAWIKQRQREEEANQLPTV